MTMLERRISQIGVLARHPDSILRYILRDRICPPKLGVSSKESMIYLNELNQKMIFKDISRDSYRANMAKRQAELYSICRALQPDLVIETGVQQGISTGFILAAMRMNQRGRLYSIELALQLPDGHPIGLMVDADLKDRWTLITGDSLSILPGLFKDIGPVDLFIHDSEHSYVVMSQEFQMAWSHIKTNHLLLSDDTWSNDAYLDFCSRVACRPVWTSRGYGLAIRS